MTKRYFGTDGIRGAVGKGAITPEFMLKLGWAAGKVFAKGEGRQKILIGKDTRISGYMFESSLEAGLSAAGVDVLLLGPMPTPAIAYLTRTFRASAGIVISASHNPYYDNGIKFFCTDGKKLPDEVELAIEAQMDKPMDMVPSDMIGKTRKLEDARGRYIEFCKGTFPRDLSLHGLRIVVDCANGATYSTGPSVLEELGAEVIPVAVKPDGLNINLNCGSTHPETLQSKVLELRADLVIAFDGDGDRLGIVTRSGKIIWPDRMLMLYARDLLSRNPGADILYDVKCTRDVAEIVSSLGGRAIMCPTGHSLVKAKMKETGAVVGGEFSGHIFFNDRWYGFDDALYSAARLLEILSMEPFTPDEVFAEIPEKLNTPELHIKVTEDSKFRIMEKMKASAQFEGGNMVTVDGVRVDFPDSWGLLRASNTTPVLVARFEGDSEAALEQAQRVFREQLLALEPGLSIPF